MRWATKWPPHHTDNNREGGEKRLAGRELGTQTRCAFDSSGGMHTDAQSQGNKAGYMAAAARATGGSMMMIIN